MVRFVVQHELKARYLNENFLFHPVKGMNNAKLLSEDHLRFEAMEVIHWMEHKESSGKIPFKMKALQSMENSSKTSPETPYKLVWALETVC